jgi:cytochrome c
MMSGRPRAEGACTAEGVAPTRLVSAGCARSRATCWALTAIALALWAACANAPTRLVQGGDAQRGRAAIAQFACGACHAIPGIPAAVGTMGPPLVEFSRRVYIAGEIPNTADNLIRWITVPQAVEPGNAMPNLGVDDRSARDIAAYLYAPR